jgi:hypothetical protein
MRRCCFNAVQQKVVCSEAWGRLAGAVQRALCKAKSGNWWHTRQAPQAQPAAEKMLPVAGSTLTVCGNRSIRNRGHLQNILGQHGGVCQRLGRAAAGGRPQAGGEAGRWAVWQMGPTMWLHRGLLAALLRCCCQPQSGGAHLERGSGCVRGQQQHASGEQLAGHAWQQPAPKSTHLGTFRSTLPAPPSASCSPLYSISSSGVPALGGGGG